MRATFLKLKAAPLVRHGKKEEMQSTHVNVMSGCLKIAPLSINCTIFNVMHVIYFTPRAVMSAPTGRSTQADSRCLKCRTSKAVFGTTFNYQREAHLLSNQSSKYLKMKRRSQLNFCYPRFRSFFSKFYRKNLFYLKNNVSNRDFFLFE